MKKNEHFKNNGSHTTVVDDLGQMLGDEQFDMDGMTAPAA